MRRRRTLVTSVSACVRQAHQLDSYFSYLQFIGLCLLFLSQCESSLTVILVIEMKFETGDDKLKDLELGVFVGAGRFLAEKGKPAVVEYKISKIVKGS